MARRKLISLEDGWLTYQRQHSRRYNTYHGRRQGRRAAQYGRRNGTRQYLLPNTAQRRRWLSREVQGAGNKASHFVEQRYTPRTGIRALFPLPPPHSTPPNPSNTLYHLKPHIAEQSHASKDRQPPPILSTNKTITSNLHPSYNPHPISQEKATHQNLKPQPSMAKNSPSGLYVQILKRANTLPPHITQRHHPWQLFTDQTPWTSIGPATTEWGSQEEETPEPLPLPPNPNHSQWRGRCYNCLTIGHNQRECTKTERVCAL